MLYNCVFLYVSVQIVFQVSAIHGQCNAGFYKLDQIVNIKLKPRNVKYVENFSMKPMNIYEYICIYERQGSLSSVFLV